MSQATRRTFAFGAAAVLAATALTAAPVTAQDEPQSGGTIVYGDWQAAAQLNPYMTNTVSNFQATTLVWPAPLDIDVDGNYVPDLSFGTHFFQDLLESSIYPLAIYLDDEDVSFNREFFYKAENCLLEYLPDAENLVDVVRLVRVNDYLPGHHIHLIMDGEAGRAVAFLEEEETE